MSNSYVELRARSAFSFGDGTATPEALAQRAAELGYSVLGLADRGDLGGSIRFHSACLSHGIRPLIGAELNLDGAPVTLLVQNQKGYRNLASLVTRSRVQSERGVPGVSFSDVAGRNEGLFLLSGCASGSISQWLRRGMHSSVERHLDRLRSIFEDRMAIEVQWQRASNEGAALAAGLVDLAQRRGVEWAVTQAPRYLDDSGRLAHDLLTALRTGRPVDDALRRGTLGVNGHWRLEGPGEVEDRWKRHREGIEATQRIAASCSFDLAWVRPTLPRYPTPDGSSEDAFLAHTVWAGAHERWAVVGERERRQIEHELEVIRGLGFAGFFLVMWDAIRYARSKRILCHGRGSAANSAVAYCLGITDVDPVRNGLLFERFLSPARTEGQTEAPDIDVDFENDRREEVLNYVYDQWKRQHAAIACMTQTYHAPTALADVMRALGYEASLARKLTKRLRHLDPSQGAEVLQKGLARRVGLDLDTPRGRALLKALPAFDELPRLRSTHPGGFVISAEPIGEFIPIETTSSGRTILQYDKDDLDAAGVAKFDFLGLGALSAVRKAFDAVELRSGERLALHTLPVEDEKTFEMIRSGDTLGVFQLESRAQIASLHQTQPEVMYDLVVQLALIRPGPLQAQFVRPYVRRRRGLERTVYAHPALEEILGRTYGIPIFQEQAMQIGMKMAGFTATEADEFRRTMGSQKKLPRLQAALEHLVSRLVGRGISEPVARGIASDLKGFANYGFPESHSWSFALTAYASAYLKAHHPAEFYLGLLQSYPMGFYPASTLIHDAVRHGVPVRGPCLKEGRWMSTLESTKEAIPALRVGWRHIRGLGDKAMGALRKAYQDRPFRSIEDVARRSGFGRREMMLLARSGALEAFAPGRRQAAWKALGAAGDRLPLAPGDDQTLSVAELSHDELIFLDYLATGISTRGHPMEHVRGRLDAMGVVGSSQLPETDPRGEIEVAGLVVIRQRPQTANGTVFLLLEDEDGFINVVIPRDIYRKHKETIDHAAFLIVRGNQRREGELIHVVGHGYRALFAGTLSHRSRDFR